MASKDRYGSFKVTYANGTVRVLVDRASEVGEQAKFFIPSSGKIVKIENA